MFIQQRKLAKALVFSGFAAALTAASPVAANSSSTAAVDITQPIREAQEDRLADSDKGFSQLFASWEALDENGPGAPVEQPTVSIPSLMPVDGARMSSGYGMRNHPVLRKRRKHNGIDLAAPTGTPVYATADGVVTRADWFSSYGLYISIDHGADLETRYAHLSKLAVADGERIEKGDVIGYVGSTGRSTGPHLHYEVRIDGVAVNPIPYMVETPVQRSFANTSTLEGRGGQ
jgi:murein DD-endopeptidase MepM/ murein hydrolase activator NlpD